MSVRLTSIMGNSQKLDGGAMFGNAPKALWTRWCDADELNRIDLACRALLVQTENHTILFETGIGVYMEPKLRERYGVVESHHVLLDNLLAAGIEHSAVTDLVLSHLHFDHAGGLLEPWQEGKASQLLFPNATFHVGRKAWERALNPHPRDRASFVPELNKSLADSGRLVQHDPSEVLHFDELAVHFTQSNGHTPGMLCSDLRWGENRLVFAADLIPGAPWVHLPITMGYDRFPEQLIDEKRELLEDLHADQGWLYFTHDANVCAGRVGFDATKKKFTLETSMNTMSQCHTL